MHFGMCSNRYTQWGSEIQPFKIRPFLRLDCKWFSLSYGYSCSPNHSKTGPFKIQTFVSGFQIFYDNMAAICSDFKWLGFRNSNHIWNWDRLQPNLFFDHSKSRLVQISDLHFYMYMEMQTSNWVLWEFFI